MESGLNYQSIAFCDTASADNTMSFALHLTFLNMIHDLWPGNNPLALTPNADFCKQDPIVSYSMVLMHEPQFLSALHYSPVARGSCPFCQKIPFSFWPQAGLPHWTLWKGSFLFHLALHSSGYHGPVQVEGHAKYVYLNPWINALVTSISLGTLPSSMENKAK